MIRAMDMVLASQRCHYDNGPRFGYTTTMLHIGDVYCALRDAEACRSVVYNNWLTEDSRRVNVCTVRQEVAKLREGRRKGKFHKATNMGPSHRYYGVAYQSPGATYVMNDLTVFLLLQLGMKAR